MSAEELRLSWQGRALYFARENPQLGSALLSMMADNFDDTMPFLLAAVFDGVIGIATPFYCSSPKIDKRGRITAFMVTKYGQKRAHVIFDDEVQMQDIFRKLADRLKLTDADRLDLFACVRHWVKADMRLDPNMDRNDPDAKRLTVH